jgi:hypothetical protein
VGPATKTPGAPHPTLPKASLPKIQLPTPKVSPPIKITSCSISVSVGPVGVHIGTCPSGHK